MGLKTAIYNATLNGENLSPKTKTSINYKHWISCDDMKRCFHCENNHGKIYCISESPKPSPPLHPNCRCTIEKMVALIAGTATISGRSGADWILKNMGRLPKYYVSTKHAKASGWSPGKWPSNFIPQKMIGGDQYKNKNGHLPQALNRIWYEADINYTNGKRNRERILWSNDGLIFVTYDHYETFYEIV